jgi:hypothetical protein
MIHALKGGFQTNRSILWVLWASISALFLYQELFPWLGDLVEERGGVHERLAAGAFVDLVDAGGNGKLDDDLIDVPVHIWRSAECAYL